MSLLIDCNFVPIILNPIEMKKIATSLLLTILSLAAFSQTDNIIKWQSTALKMDGNGTDWNNRPQAFDNNTKVAYEMRNDETNLYLIFQISDIRTQFKIARAGMSLTLETKTKPKRKADIYVSPFINEKPGEHRPDQGQEQGQGQRQGQGERKGPSFIKQKYMLMPPDILTSGFAFTNDEISLNKDSKKVMFVADWDSSNCMTIEVLIPLRELYGDNFDLTKVSADEISLTLEEKAIERPTPQGDGNSGGGERPGGGEGGFQHGNGGGYGQQNAGGGSHQYGGQGQGQGDADRTSMFETQQLKQKFRLNPTKK